MEQPFLLLIDGMTGSGKTTTTKLLATKLPRTAVVRMDVVKKFISDFERGVRDNTIAKSVIFEMVRKYLDLGISVILDQIFKDEEIERYDLLAKECNLSRYYKFQLVANPETAYARVMGRQKDREDKVPEDRVLRNISLFASREDRGFVVIDTSKLPEDGAADLIFKKIFDK